MKRKISHTELVSSLRGKPTAEDIGEKNWNPQAHFTDLLSNPQTPKVKALVDKYAPHVVGYFITAPLGWDSYSLELQFDDEEIASRCIEEYEKIPQS